MCLLVVAAAAAVWLLIGPHHGVSQAISPPDPWTNAVRRVPLLLRAPKPALFRTQHAWCHVCALRDDMPRIAEPPRRVTPCPAEDGEGRGTTAAEAGLADPSVHTTRTGQEMWARVRSTAFRHKLQTAAMFLQNDDENEKAAKAAIREVMARVRVPYDTLAAPQKCVGSGGGGGGG
eukprot:COSAG01_NODE_3467_length_6056_cov_2.509820_1_plen_176_part_00